MSRSKKYLIVFVSIILLLTAVYNIQFKYLKVYDGLWYYVPTDEEKEVIVYMGERDYKCKLDLYADDYIFSRYDELDDEIGIYCSKERGKIEPSKETIKINGNTYDVKITIRINKINEEYIVSIGSSVFLKEDDSDSYSYKIEYNHRYAPYYDSTEEIYTEENFNLSVKNSTCSMKYYDVIDGEGYLLNTKDINNNGEFYIRDNENEGAGSLEEKITSCNNILDAGYGEAMYYDVIEPLEKEMNDIKKYSEEILN